MPKKATKSKKKRKVEEDSEEEELEKKVNGTRPITSFFGKKSKVVEEKDEEVVPKPEPIEMDQEEVPEPELNKEVVKPEEVEDKEVVVIQNGHGEPDRKDNAEEPEEMEQDVFVNKEKVPGPEEEAVVKNGHAEPDDKDIEEPEEVEQEVFVDKEIINSKEVEEIPVSGKIVVLSSEEFLEKENQESSDIPEESPANSQPHSAEKKVKNIPEEIVIDSQTSSASSSPLKIKRGRKKRVISSSQEESQGSESKDSDFEEPPRRRSSRIQKQEIEREERKKVAKELEASLEIIESESSESSGTEAKKRSKRNKGKSPGNKKIASIFLSAKERKELEKAKEEKEKAAKNPPKPQLKKETLAFLHSGLPEEILKAQRAVEKRKEEELILEKLNYFPKTSHTDPPEFAIHLESFNPSIKFKEAPVQEICISQKEFPFKSKKEDAQNEILKQIEHQLCCGEDINQDFSLSLGPSPSAESVYLPWINNADISSRKSIVANKKSMAAFENWLKQWRRDIKDDGGVSRKIEKRRKNDENDWITSDEEDIELKKKSVILSGPSGCGKMAVIQHVAEKYNFKVVEENFSGKRSGKDVIARIEQATLSNRIESDCDSLILFKDVDLYYEEDDEGFWGAISQLITASCRPICLTTNLQINSSLDSKIERLDPLWIHFEAQIPNLIVDQILPQFFSRDSQLMTDSEEENFEKAKLTSWLHSIVRHSNHDIRKSINMSQFYFNSPNFVQDFHSSLGPFDLNFVSRFDRDKDRSNTIVNSKEGRVNIKWLKRISMCLSMLADVDVCKMKGSEYEEDLTRSKDNFFRIISLMSKKSSGEEVRTFVRGIMYENDQDFNLLTSVESQSDELANYIDSFDPFGRLNAFENLSYARTIVKTNLLSSIGNEGRRNKRMSTHFTRLDKNLIEKITQTFDFQKVYGKS